MEVTGQLHVPVALLQGKWTPVLIGQEGGWTPEPVCTEIAIMEFQKAWITKC
jgi:hypothetical protein